MKVELSLETPQKQAESMRKIADEIDAGRALVLDVQVDPRNGSILVFRLLGVKRDS